jgi:hypothetical protein
MASLQLPDELSESQIGEMLEALKKLGKIPKHDDEGSSGSVGAHMNIPKLPNFSGEVPIPKGEVSFEVWKFEVSCLKEDGLHKEKAITQGARKSLRGEASRIVMNSLGHQATIMDILDKFDGIYGTIETGEELIQRFYNATQSPGEGISSWGCRLEDLLTKANRYKKLTPSTKDDMLRTRFWNGLYDSTLKNTTCYKYDHIKNFDELRREVRKMDQEMSAQDTIPKKGTKVQHHLQVTDFSSQIETLSNKITNLEKKLDSVVNEGQSKSDELVSHLLTKVEGLVDRLDRLEYNLPVRGGQGQGHGQGYSGYNGPSRFSQGPASYHRGRGRAHVQSSNRYSHDRHSYTQPGDKPLNC